MEMLHHIHELYNNMNDLIDHLPRKKKKTIRSNCSPHYFMKINNTQDDIPKRKALLSEEITNESNQTMFGYSNPLA